MHNEKRAAIHSLVAENGLAVEVTMNNAGEVLNVTLPDDTVHEADLIRQVGRMLDAMAYGGSTCAEHGAHKGWQCEACQKKPPIDPKEIPF